MLCKEQYQVALCSAASYLINGQAHLPSPGGTRAEHGKPVHSHLVYKDSLNLALTTFRS